MELYIRLDYFILKSQAPCIFLDTWWLLHVFLLVLIINMYTGYLVAVATEYLVAAARFSFSVVYQYVH